MIRKEMQAEYSCHMNLFFSRFAYFGVMQTTQAHEAFRKAFLDWASSQKRGFQAKLSRRTEISPVIINEILREKRAGTEDQRRAIASAIGYDYEDFLDLGRESETKRQLGQRTPEGDYYSAPLVDGKIAAGAGGVVNEDEIKSRVWIYAPELRGRPIAKTKAVKTLVSYPPFSFSPQTSANQFFLHPKCTHLCS